MSTTNPMQQGAKANGASERDHWQTPEYILKSIDLFFNKKWLDAAPPNPLLNSLKRDWPTHKGVYINPPFSQYKAWTDHFIKQPCAQIWMMHHKHDTQWFETLMERACAICMLHKRVIFIDPKTGQPAVDKNGKPATAIDQRQSLLYIPAHGETPKLKRFCGVFCGLGYIVRPYRLL